jgi:hypothetical protein
METRTATERRNEHVRERELQPTGDITGHPWRSLTFSDSDEDWRSRFALSKVLGGGNLLPALVFGKRAVSYIVRHWPATWVTECSARDLCSRVMAYVSPIFSTSKFWLLPYL